MSDIPVHTPAPPPPGTGAPLPYGPTPRDAAAMQELLASMGIQPGSYQPRVIAQLMEFQNSQHNIQTEAEAEADYV